MRRADLGITDPEGLHRICKKMISAMQPALEGIPLPVVASDPKPTAAAASSSSAGPSAAAAPQQQQAEEEPQLAEPRERPAMDADDLVEDTKGSQAISEEAQRARARGIPTMPPVADRLTHRLAYMPFRNWCVD